MVTVRQVSNTILEANTFNAMRKVQQVSPSGIDENIDSKSENWHQVNRKRIRKFLVSNAMNTDDVETVPRLVSFIPTDME